MYEVTTLDGDYRIETFDTLEQAQACARRLVNRGVLVGCQIWHGGRAIETVSLY